MLKDLWPEGKFSNIQYEVEYLGKQMRAVLRLAADPDEGSLDTPRERLPCCESGVERLPDVI